MKIISALAGALGFSSVKFILLGLAAAALFTAWFAYRESLIQTGWDRAIQGVQKKDAAAVAGARRLQGDADACYREGGAWSVITRDCTMEASKQ